ncbi:SDR family oxidoreductase, partial [Candidatus Pelagibacter sp.]|uniref:SDR family oxidoreductase n=1 Tax=Candidatus Pelagibacter sp. TaxID=2024849 RepID=UPI003F83C8D6
MKKKKILILGSEGQIGGHLVKYLQKNTKFRVIKFDIVLNKKNDLRKSNNKLLEKKIKNSDFVYFLAFDVGGSKYLKKYQKTFEFLENNLLIMTNTFQLLKKYKKKFIFASSQMSNMDFSSYGVLKKIGEELTKSLNCIYVKFWNVYGIEKNLDKSHVITDFVLMGLKKNKINMLTNGMEEREFLYAEDCSRGLVIIMNKFDFFLKQQKEIHLTNGKKTKIIQIAQIIKKLLKKKNVEIKILPSIRKDNLQNNINNKSNGFFLNYWKP